MQETVLSHLKHSYSTEKQVPVPFLEAYLAVYTPSVTSNVSASHERPSTFHLGLNIVTLYFSHTMTPIAIQEDKLP